MILSITDTPVLPSTRRKNELRSIVHARHGQGQGDATCENGQDETGQLVLAHVEEDGGDGAGPREHGDGQGKDRYILAILALLVPRGLRPARLSQEQVDGDDEHEDAARDEKDPGWMPRKRRMAFPLKMKTHRTTNATMTAFRIVARRRRCVSPPVREMKTGTMPKGSMTMNTARKRVMIWLASVMGSSV